MAVAKPFRIDGDDKQCTEESLEWSATTVIRLRALLSFLELVAIKLNFKHEFRQVTGLDGIVHDTFRFSEWKLKANELLQPFTTPGTTKIY